MVCRRTLYPPAIPPWFDMLSPRDELRKHPLHSWRRWPSGHGKSPPQWLATFRTCAVHAERGMAGCMPQPGGAAPLPGRRYSVDDVEGILYRRIRVFRSDPGIKIWYHKLSLRKDVPSR
jgi:hypothetical protein